MLVLGAEHPDDTFLSEYEIKYLGRVDDEKQLAVIYNVADVIVSPSLQENLSNSIVEGLSCGVPIVAFDIGGNIDLITHKLNGYLAKPFDSDDLAKGINWVLDTDLYLSLSRNAREKVINSYSYHVELQLNTWNFINKLLQKMIDSKKNDIISKALTSMLIILSGNYPVRDLLGATSGSVSLFFWISVIFILFLLSDGSRRYIPREPIFYVYIVTLSVLMLAQTTIFGSFDSGNYLIQYSFPLLVVSVLSFCRIKFLSDAPKVVIFLIKLSLFFWIPTIILSVIGINVLALLPKSMLFADNAVTFKTHFIIHNFRSSFTEPESVFKRNCGLFWEPGAFAGIITFVYVLVNLKKELFTKKELFQINFWFLIGILTAQSTTGLIVFGLTFFVDKIKVTGNIATVLMRVLFSVVLFSAISYEAYVNLPVLGDKIQNEMEVVSKHGKGSESSRLGTLLITLKIIKENPYAGIGFSYTKLKNELLNAGYKADAAAGNGMFLYVTQSGIPFFVFVIFLWYYGMYVISSNKMKSLFGVFYILLLLQGEDWMAYSIVYVFIFLPIIKTNETYLYSYTDS